MRRKHHHNMLIPLAVLLLTAACGEGKRDPSAEAPPPATVVQDRGVEVIRVAHPEQFPIATALAHAVSTSLTVTGVVNPDVSRTVPVISLASGRVVDIRARLGDSVKKGQLLLRVQSNDISGAFSDYQKAAADQTLAHSQLTRSKDLYTHGAISQSDLELAQDAAQKADVDFDTAREHLQLLGSDPARPSGIVDVRAPVSGVIVEQNITDAGGVKTLDNSPNLFTIADLSSIWVLCDVYENDLSQVRLGESADITLNSYPGQVFQGRVDNIGAVLDPTIRTAKVRIELPNPGIMRVGMFVTATFLSPTKETLAAVPASAVLHLHDRDWIYIPAGGNSFRRVGVTAGDMLPGNMQLILFGIKPGQQVVANALELQNTAEQ
jgi:cobalt-zinc-cadmium efflux system membrane fusion protein